MKFFVFVLVVGLFFAITSITGINAANILGLFPLKFRSHYIMFGSIMSELVNRGHNVTVVSGFPKSTPVANFTDINVGDCQYLPDQIFSLDGAYKSHNPFYQIYIFMELANNFEPILRCPSLAKLLAASTVDTSYDLIITELFNSDVMLGFVQKFQAPFVTFSAQPMYPWGADRTGNPDNPSYITYTHSSSVLNRKNSTFYQRFFNSVVYIFARTMYYLTNLKCELMKENHFNFTSPTLSEIAKNTSLILSFSHFSVNDPIPLVPNVIEVAGLQINKVAPLPKCIEKFINESEYGVIYFSMGSLLKTETMPEAKRNAFLDAFSKVPQRVLWKWGNDTLPGKTDDIFISKWMPQRDILAHPKIKLFISHGGALGLNEAVYEGVPVLGIPMYADQTLNLKPLEWHGSAEILEYTDIDKENVLFKIQRILQNSEYSKNMKKVSAIYKDRPMSAMDTAIYWIEYVIRHKGAPHLRSTAIDLPIHQYLLLDVIAFLLVVCLTFLVMVYYCIKMLIKFAFKSRPKLKPKINSKKTK